MNLLTIYPIQSCNLSCYYCPNKKWTYPVNHHANKLNNKLIFKWIDKYLNPREWLIEISGGEPGVYPEIKGLVEGLSDRGYYGLVKTNGTLPIPHTATFKRVAAWHEIFGIDKPPQYADSMLIMRNPKDCWQQKKQYCIDHNIPYKDVDFQEFHRPEALRTPGTDAKRKNRFIDFWTVVYSGGRISSCYCDTTSEDIRIQNMSEPRKANIKKKCPYCQNVGGFEIFFPEEWITSF